MRHFATLAACCLLMHGQSVHAQEHYIEVGDFSNSAGSPTVLAPALGVGENSVSGSISSGGFDADVDYFRVQLLPDTAITAISLTVTNHNGGFPTTLDIVGAGNSGQIPIIENAERQAMPTFTVSNTDAIVFRLPDPATFNPPSFDYTLYIEVISVAPPGPTLRLDGSGQLSWNAETGAVYQVQWNASLDTNSWNNLGGPVTAVVDTVTVADDIAAVMTRFYRLVDPATL